LQNTRVTNSTVSIFILFLSLSGCWCGIQGACLGRNDNRTRSAARSSCGVLPEVAVEDMES